MLNKLLILLVLLPGIAFAQVAVTLAPVAHMQFLSSSGLPLANGKVFTYDAGTTNLRNTYKDSTGIPQNTDPIILDAGGFADIWLANQSYKFVVQNSLGVQQWTVDNITGYLGLLNLANTWTFPQTFTQPITDTATDNQFVLGAPGNQMTLDSPPPTGNQTLHFPVITDTLVARTTTDTLTNKTLTSPTNITTTVNTLPNQNPTGTTLNTLTKLVNAPSQAQIAATTDTGGVVGICVAGCGNAGSATIQQIGTTSCVFDGATTAGDYVQISSTTAGNCHDTGATYPSSGQVIGRVLSTNGGSGTYTMQLFAMEIKPPPVVFKSGTQVVHTGDLTEDTIWSASIPPLQASSQIRVFFTYNQTVQDANVTTYRVRLNGTLVAIISGVTGTAFYVTNHVTIANRGATNSQFSITETFGTSGTLVINSATASAVDTSVTRTLTVTAQNATTAANSQQFDVVEVEVLP